MGINQVENRIWLFQVFFFSSMGSYIVFDWRMWSMRIHTHERPHPKERSKTGKLVIWPNQNHQVSQSTIEKQVISRWNNARNFPWVITKPWYNKLKWKSSLFLDLVSLSFAWFSLIKCHFFNKAHLLSFKTTWERWWRLSRKRHVTLCSCSIKTGFIIIGFRAHVRANDLDDLISPLGKCHKQLIRKSIV